MHFCVSKCIAERANCDCEFIALSIMATETHLTRFHRDPTQHLSGYGVFHGDERQALGDPLPTGSLRRSGVGLRPSTAQWPTGTYQPFGGVPQSAYLVQQPMSLRATQRPATAAITTPSTGAKTIASNRSIGLGSTAYEFPSGTYYSTSGEIDRACMHVRQRIRHPCCQQLMRTNRNRLQTLDYFARHTRRTTPPAVQGLVHRIRGRIPIAQGEMRA